MQIFSKRYKAKDIPVEADDDKFLSSELRLKLISIIDHAVESNQYIETFLILEDHAKEQYHKNKYTIHTRTINEVANRELGYFFSKYFNFSPLQFKIVNDFILLDFIEILIIFSKDNKRSDFVSNIKYVLEGETDFLTIYKGNIIVKSLTELKSLVPLINDMILRRKLKSYYENQIDPDYQLLSKISADILQRVFSSKSKNKTKEESEKICQELANIWGKTSKTKEKIKNLISDEVKLTKGFNNEIENIRHTDKSTLNINSPILFKLITVKSITLVELVILNFPEKYLSFNNPKIIKQEYFKRYEINSAYGWEINKPKNDDEFSDLSF